MIHKVIGNMPLFRMNCTTLAFSRKLKISYSQYSTMVNFHNYRFTDNLKFPMHNILNTQGSLQMSAHHKRWFTEEKIRSNFRKSNPDIPGVYSKYDSDKQFDIIKEFISNAIELPSHDEWTQLRSRVLDVPGE